MARSLIAVVNDDVPFLEMMEQLLEDEGYRVLVMNEAGQAYARIKRQRPELVILDVRLGDPDAGWRVLEALRLDRAVRSIPVIVCSADLRALQERAEYLRRMGCECLPKPFDVDQLLTKVEEVLGPSPRAKSDE
jgi:DNA-binding response OmpR family regulator